MVLLLSVGNVMVLSLSAGNVVQSLSFSSIVPLTIWAFTFDWPLLDPAPALGSKFVLGTGRVPTYLLHACTPKSGLHTRAVAVRILSAHDSAICLSAPGTFMSFQHQSRVLATLLQAPRGRHILPPVTGNSLVQACMAHTYHMQGGAGGAVESGVCVVLAGVLLSGLLTYNSKQWLPALQKRLSKEKAS